MSEWIPLVASVIGAIGGIVTLIVIVFRIGRRVGQLETDMQALKQAHIDQREWGELRQKVSTLYAIYVEHVLRQTLPPRENRSDRDPQ